MDQAISAKTSPDLDRPVPPNQRQLEISSLQHTAEQGTFVQVNHYFT